MRYFKWAKRRKQKRGRQAMRRSAPRGLLKSIDFEQIEVIRFFTQSLVVTGLAVGIGIVTDLLQGRPIAAAETLRQVIENPVYMIVIAALAILHIRLILFRLEQKTQTP